MASLKSGSITKLLEDMNVNEKGSEDVRKPVLLQIRSIIPVLEKDDLWPNRGFYLKVSDLSHATYVSLPHEQDEMILSNKLQLGQFIYVQKFGAAYPVPLLRGVMPVSGRRSCDGTPKDIIPVHNLVKFLETSDTELVKDKGVISEQRTVTHGLSDSESFTKTSTESGEKRSQGKSRSLSASRARPSGQKRALNCNTKMGQTIRSESSSIENDTDSDSPKSTISLTQMSKRRSWNETELLDVKEIFYSSTVKHETRTIPRSRSVCVSPIRSVRDDSSDDNSTSRTRRGATRSATKSVKSSNRSIPAGPKIKCEETPCPKAICNDVKVTDSKIIWDSFPSSLVKLGKDMIRHRDVATLAAVEALQEACAAEKLIKCLSMYSEINSSKGDDDPQPLIDKFFKLQDDLAQTRLVLQSLTNISPLRTSDSDINSTGSVKEVLNLAVERKKKATSCIKSAISYDLSPCSCSLRPAKNTSKIEKKASSASRINTPKVSYIVRKQRKNDDVKVGVASNKDQPSDWVKGSNFGGAAYLANVLQDESRKSFMVYVEKFLEKVEKNTSMLDSSTKIAGMMYQIKRVNDWLDIVNKEANSDKNGRKESWLLDDSGIEACGRVRNKIYNVLLKHVERTAMALENMNKAGQV